MVDQLQIDTNKFIESCLDVNNSWVEVFNDLAILHTLDLELGLEGSIVGDCIIEEMTEKGYEIDDNDLNGLVRVYFTQTYEKAIPDSFWEIEANVEYAVELAINNGADEYCVSEYLESILKAA